MSGDRPALGPRMMQRLMTRITPVHVWLYRRLNGRGGVDRATNGAPLVLLTTVGRRSGRRRSVVIGHIRDGDDVIVPGTNGGLHPLPGWVHNLRSDPLAEVQVRCDRYAVRAEFLEGSEWDRCWVQLLDAFPVYEKAKEWAGRDVPLIRLKRASI